MVEGHEVARFLTWAALITRRDAASAAGNYAQQVRKWYLDLARGTKHTTHIDAPEAGETGTGQGNAWPTVDDDCSNSGIDGCDESLGVYAGDPGGEWQEGRVVVFPIVEVPNSAMTSDSTTRCGIGSKA